MKNGCEYCGKRAYVTLTARDAVWDPVRVLVCPACGPFIAAAMQPGTVQLIPLPDYRTIGWSLRWALIWAAIILALPVLAGMIVAAVELITGR